MSLVTYVEAHNAQGLRGYQVAINASPPKTQADTGHLVLWATSAGLMTLDASSTQQTLATLAGTETLTNKTLTTPIIGNFSSATHNHQNNSGGGSLDAAAIGSGTLASARVDWANPGAIGSTTPAAGTFTEVGIGATTARVQINGAAGNARGVLIKSGFGGTLSNRWFIYADGIAEGGANAGSDLRIQRSDDSGAAISDVLVIKRSNGNITLSGTLGINGITALASQYNTTGTATGFTAGAGTTVTHLSTFTGNTGSTAYTIGDLVRYLKLAGHIAS